MVSEARGMIATMSKNFANIETHDFWFDTLGDQGCMDMARKRNYTIQYPELMFMNNYQLY